jgi:alkanesulfonate monooxygenase SsuD/methylene tetrahydromethanopterin reductase-like flavin-dependent oxidoreductase (luciferase family)
MSVAPISILDLAPISAGSDAPTALRNTVELAQHAEQWGYRRFWLAEHHFVAVASAIPALLIGQIAAATKTIRVGSAAVQLGNTTAAAVVESFGMLDAFYPGRIDLGVGRSGRRREEANKAKVPPQPRKPKAPREWREVDGVVIPAPINPFKLLDLERLAATSSVLQQPEAVAPEFAQQLDDIIAMFAGTYQVNGIDVHVVPGEGAPLTPWIFGSSKGLSAQVAGALGLPFVASYHLTPTTALEGIEAYRAAFKPSKALSEPYVVVSADIVVADDTDTARHLASTYGHWVYSIRTTGSAIAYLDPDTAPPLTEEQQELVKDRTATQFVGNADEVAERLEALQRFTRADELVITSVTFRHEDRLRSHELIAKRWGLTA